MKTLGVLFRIIGALAAIAAIAFVIVRYGDKIVAWTKKTLAGFGCTCCQEPVEEVIEAEEVDATEEAVAAEEDTIQAEDQDFEG